MRQMAATLMALVTVTSLSVAQTKTHAKQDAKGSSTSTVLLVDTDDTCRLSVDGDDQGVVTPAESKKVSIALGEHVVKCVIDDAPDLAWRKVVQATSSEQVAAMVTLKALHIQYENAVGKAEEQQHQAEEDQAAAAQAEFRRPLLQTAPDCHWVVSAQGRWVPQGNPSQKCDNEIADVISTIAPLEHNMDANNHVRTAFEAVNVVDALKELDLAIKADPNFAYAHFVRGGTIRFLVRDAWTDKTHHDGVKDSGIKSLQASLLLDPNGAFADNATKLLEEAGAPTKLDKGDLAKILDSIIGGIRTN